MLVSGRVIIIDNDITIKQVLRQIETSNLRRSDRYIRFDERSESEETTGDAIPALNTGPNYQKLAF